MIGTGARRDLSAHAAAKSGSSDPEPSYSARRVVLIAGVCAALGACSAQNRVDTASSATPQTSEQVAAAAVSADGQPAAAQGQVVAIAGQPIPGQPATVQVAAAQTVAQPGQGSVVAAAPKPAASVGAKAIVVAGSTKIGRSGGGVASWYGDRFHGRKTANGERFDMGGFTAAHRTFPLPSYVRVTNVQNGRSIVVRVNDRGPFHGSRVIDVSRRTADVLGFRGNGVGNVKLDLIGAAPKTGSDDRRLLASYQEFGHPTVAPGTQVAGLTPVTDADLANETVGYGGRAYAVASAAVTTSVAAVSSGASAVASTTRAAVRSIIPASAPAKAPQPSVQTVAVASAAPSAAPAAVSAYAPPQPLLASAPTAITDPAAVKTRRVITPSTEPVLASSTPAIAAPAAVAPEPAPVRTASAADVQSRIAASFDSFSAFGR